MNHKYKPGDLVDLNSNLIFIIDIYKLTPFIDQYVCYFLDDPDKIIKMYTRDVDEPNWQHPKTTILGEYND